MVILKKQISDDGSEWVDPVELIDESNPQSFRLFAIAKACTDVMMYFIENSPDAFGNAPYARLEGFMSGYLAGAKLELKKKGDVWDVIKGSRVILRIEVPKLPDSYYECLKDNAKTRADVFGY